MTKVEKEKPVVSKELAKQFGKLRRDHSICPSTVCDALVYDPREPERENLSSFDFEKLLIDMYSIGYEVQQ